MSPEYVITVGRETLITAATLAAPVLAVGLVVGLCIAIFQAVTSIQEQTLSIIPKMLAVVTMLMVIMPWMLNKMLGFAYSMFDRVADMAQ